MKVKELDPEGGVSLASPLDPPMQMGQRLVGPSRTDIFRGRATQVIIQIQIFLSP